MRPYVLRRLALAVPTLVLVSVIVFSIMRLMPGDVVIRMVEGHAYAPQVEPLRQELGLDRPAPVQYVEWVSGILLRGAFGNPYWTRQPIWDEFIRRFPVTLELAALTILSSVVIGILVGIVSAVRQDTVSDYVGRVLAILALSIPYFGLAVLVVVLPSIYFKWTRVYTYVAFTADPLENLKIMLVPALVFGVTRAGPIMRIMRSALLEVLRQDYIRTAWSKGLPERAIVLRHALKNALIPVVSLVGLQMPLYIGGSVIIEAIFRLPGVGHRARRPAPAADAAVVRGGLGQDGAAQAARHHGRRHRARDAAAGRAGRRAVALRLRGDEPPRAVRRRERQPLAGHRPDRPRRGDADPVRRPHLALRRLRRDRHRQRDRDAAGDLLRLLGRSGRHPAPARRRRLDGVPRAPHPHVDHVAAGSERAEHHARAGHRGRDPRLAHRARGGAVDPREHLHRGRAGDGLRAHARHARPHPAQRAADHHRGGDDRAVDGDPHRGEPVVPRAGGAAALSDLGRHAVAGGARPHVPGTLARHLAGGGAVARRFRLQHAGRRAPRPARPAAEGRGAVRALPMRRPPAS